MLFVAASSLCDHTLQLIAPECQGLPKKGITGLLLILAEGLAFLSMLGLSKLYLQVQSAQSVTHSTGYQQTLSQRAGLTWGQGIGPALPSSHLRRLSTAESMTVGMYTRLRQSVLSLRIVRSCAGKGWCWTQHKF